jgi:manganese/zinc/iron transport system substrate-binding protein
MHVLKRFSLVLLCLVPSLTVIMTSGCGGPGPSDAKSTTTSDISPDGRHGPIRVIATVGMVADLVRQIGGEQVQVKQLMGPGVDPHLYQGNRDDMQQILASDICFASGLMLEGRLNSTLTQLGKQKPVFAVADLALKAGLLNAHLMDDHHPDPHVWMDIEAWSSCAEIVKEKLMEFDPQNASLYQERSVSLRQQLKALHEYGRSCVASVPESRRVLITSHDAFGYFGRAYGIQVIGVQGISTDSEAGLQRINDLVDLLVSRKVTAVFVESSVPAKNMQALIDGAAARGQPIVIGGELYSDAMGPEGSWEGTYVGMLDHNITTITRALGGTAPERGFAGRLPAGSATSGSPASESSSPTQQTKAP